jgi:hypothetical protein
MIVAAMSEEVKGAIVGACYGPPSSWSAFAEAWLARVWEQRRTVEAAATELVHLLPEIANHSAEGPKGAVASHRFGFSRHFTRDRSEPATLGVDLASATSDRVQFDPHQL